MVYILKIYMEILWMNVHFLLQLEISNNSGADRESVFLYSSPE